MLKSNMEHHLGTRESQNYKEVWRAANLGWSGAIFSIIIAIADEL